MEKFIVTSDVTKKVKHFNLQGRTLEFKIKPVPSNEEPERWIKSALNQIVEKGVEGLSNEDKVGFSFCSKDFTRGDGWINFKNVSEVTFEHVWDMVSKIYQSNSSSLSTETFCLGITGVHMPAGRGRGKHYNTFEEECRIRRGIISINNKDNLCLPRALVVAAAYANNDPDYQRVRKDVAKMQTIRTLQLLSKSGVVVPEEGAGIPELQQLQDHLTDYTITVYNYRSKGRDVIFKGAGGAKKLNLLYHNRHYNVITSLTSAFVCSYFCEKCNQPYNTKSWHRCGSACPCCQKSPKCAGNEKQLKCNDCYRHFRGQECYDNHKYGDKSVCVQFHRCRECLKTVKSDRQHTCGEIFCKNCSTHVPSNHLCFIKCDKQTAKKNVLFVFYDFETRQETVTPYGLLHEPSLCVYKQCCEQCLECVEDPFCEKCGVRVHILKNNPVEDFMTYVMGVRKNFKEVIVIGHNAGRFDHQFLLNYILTKTDIIPELIMNGTKLVVMTVGNVKFLDSLNYFHMALSKLPTVFGFAELKKGYFCHLFNTTENQNYVGPVPPIEFYDPDNMMEQNRQNFLQWYSTLSKDYVFDFQKEIVDYCVSDVEILARACLEFRKLMIREGGVCPFTEAATLPSACNKIFRRNFLRPNTIGIIPKGGYRCKDTQSKIATQWLLWTEKQWKINIQHSVKGQEARINGLKVDGFCSETGQIFEFHGCYFHGCPRCYTYNRDAAYHDNPSITMESRYEDTVAKTQLLRAQNFEVIEKWECEFRKEMSEEITTYTENHPLMKQLPLNPRDAFYGGRTDATKTYYKVSGNEKIKYVDICSLYPWTNKYQKYPIGHPQVFIGEDCKTLHLSSTEGLIKCKVLPPQNLYHPVLPLKLNDRLIFCLCCTCAKFGTEKTCKHSDEDRALTGVWVMDEVRKAIEKGYKVLEIYEVWKYQTEQYNPETRSGGLFTSYMNKFLKIKQEASGWPSHCDNDVEKQKYIRDFLDKEGVQLNPDRISKNPGLRQLGKALITSFWGKFGQRENQQKTDIVNNPEQFFKLLVNPAINVNIVLPVNENTLIVNWEYKEEVYDPLTTVNVVIAGYTTAQARLKLYSYLEILDNRVLYYDTDSVIYISRPGEWDIPLGDFLGDMTDELNGEYIEEFVSGGPKLYSFRQLPSGKETIKVKGICINSNAAKLVNFEKLRNMITKTEEPVHITLKNIKRTADHQVVTRTEQKVFRPNLRKRVFTCEGYDSLPYGYIKNVKV